VSGARPGLRTALAALVTLGTLAVAPPASAGPWGTAKTVVLYVPNRLLDALDVFRARARLGPGAAASVRVTEVADLFLGSYSAAYFGLPGPRGRRAPKLPLGFEARAGAEVGPADVSGGAGFGPDYSATELGLGFQAAILGLDVGFDPWELVDFGAGLLLFDPRDDDL